MAKLMALLAAAFLTLGMASCSSGSDSGSAPNETTTTLDASKCEAALTAFNEGPDEGGPEAAAEFNAVTQSCSREQFLAIAGRIFKQYPEGVFETMTPSEYLDFLCGPEDPPLPFCQ
jgi:hypothetical protein